MNIPEMQCERCESTSAPDNVVRELDDPFTGQHVEYACDKCIEKAYDQHMERLAEGDY